MLLELRYQHMNKLSKYERGLVRSLLSGTDGLGIDPSDRLIGDYLTDKQIDCVKRLYADSVV